VRRFDRAMFFDSVQSVEYQGQRWGPDHHSAKRRENLGFEARDYVTGVIGRRWRVLNACQLLAIFGQQQSLLWH